MKPKKILKCQSKIPESFKYFEKVVQKSLTYPEILKKSPKKE